MSFLSFPPNFLWGTATAAHQVEGQNFNNDWWDWEQTPGHIKHGDTSRVACDWWNGRYREDFDLARAMEQNTHRLSVEWSRIEPSEGKFDANAIDYYREMLRALLDRGMTPMVTLHHFTMPRWVASAGGWENPDVIQMFARFVRYSVGKLQDLCDIWITINEPNVVAYEGYASGIFPPGVKDLSRAFRVLANEVRAHAAAYYVIKDLQPRARVGLAHHTRPFFPHRPNSPADRLMAHLRNYIFNWLVIRAVEDGHLRFPLGRSQFLPEVRGTQDFIGFNYYYTDHVNFDPTRLNDLFCRSVLDPLSTQLQEIFSSVGNIDSWGMEETLRELARYGKPIYITENGVFEAPNLQPYYLVSHLAAVHRAMEGGADVRGYYWWTLTDNFEWAEGYTSRFGLYHLDVETQARTPKPVANLYARIIREHGVAEELQEQYGRPQ